MNTLPLDEDSCYEACAGREHAWDGHFVLAVTSTGIYCRPSCPARLPRRENCRFFATAAAAVAEAGENGLRESLRLTRSKAATLHALAVELAGGLRVDPWVDRGETRSRLLGIRGIGAWTTEFIAMRGLGDPDACPSGDLVLQRALGLATSRQVLARAEAWRPWRSRAVMHLWTKESYL